jgi:rhamnosyltransferase
MTRVLPQTRSRSSLFLRQIALFVPGLILAFALSRWDSPWKWPLFVLEMIAFGIYAWAYSLNLQERFYLLNFLKKVPAPADNTNKLEKICAVIVCYFPEDSLLENVQQISKQVDQIILIDNGSPANFKPLFKQIEAQGHRIIYSPTNLGIAAALNIGFFHAQKMGFSWVATFDQDSTPVNNLTEIMRQTLRKHPHPHLVALVSCSILDRTSGRYLRQNLSVHWGEIVTAITSGNLVRISAFETVKGYDESLFIDYVDHDFCFKLLRHGYRVIEASEAILAHSCGSPKIHRLWNFVYFASHHSEIRRYYNTRNRFTVYGRYFWFELQWVIEDFSFFCKEVVKIVLAEDKKIEKIRHIILGLAHCIQGKRGPYQLKEKL